MATITIEVTDLVQTLTEFQDTHDMSDRALGFALGVSKNTPHNWRSGREMNLTPQLQDRIARLLQITPPEVLELHGYDLSPDVPAGDMVAQELGPSHDPAVDGAHNVVRMPQRDRPDGGGEVESTTVHYLRASQPELPDPDEPAFGEAS